MTTLTGTQIIAALELFRGYNGISNTTVNGQEAFYEDVWHGESLDASFSSPLSQDLQATYSGGGYTVGVLDGPASQTPLLPHVAPAYMPSGLDADILESGTSYPEAAIGVNIANEVWTSGLYSAGAIGGSNYLDFSVVGAVDFCNVSIAPTT